MGGRRKVIANSTAPKTWETFLRCDENKTALFGLLADRIAGMTSETAILVAKDEHVLSNSNKELSQISPRKKADIRMFMHTKDATVNDSNSIMLFSSDTDIVVIGISVFARLDV